MPGSYASIRKTIRHLCAQTAKDRLEVVIVTTPGKIQQINSSELAAVGAWQVVTVPEIRVGAEAWAVGIASAKGAVVVLAEDHSYPEPQWAATLLEAHRGNYSAVAPAVCNGNPGSLTSWANFLLCFLDWYAPDQDREILSGPGHNTSYKLADLTSYDGHLARLMNPERLLHMDFARNGRRMFLASQACTHHVNISRFPSYVRQSFHGGRVFGAGRRDGWSFGKRLLYAGAFWLVPPIRLRRIFAALNTPEKRSHSRFWPASPLIMIGLLSHALGEAAGYLWGMGGSLDAYMTFEMFRSDHILRTERHLLN